MVVSKIVSSALTATEVLELLDVARDSLNTLAERLEVVNNGIDEEEDNNDDLSM